MKRSKGKGRSKDSGAGAAAGNKKLPDDADNTCPICYDADQGIRVYQYIRTTCCSYKMCTECMKKWLETKSTCPVCHNILKTKRSQEKLFKNTVETKEGGTTSFLDQPIYRDFASPGEVGEMFRAQRDKVIKEKEDEQRRATIEFLAGERQAGGSADTAQELDPEEFAREQLRLLENVAAPGSFTDQDLERDEAAARELQAQLEANDEAEKKRRLEEEEKSMELAMQIQEEERRKSEEHKAKRKREAEDGRQLRRRRRGERGDGEEEEEEEEDGWSEGEEEEEEGGGEGEGEGEGEIYDSDESAEFFDTKCIENPRGATRKSARSDRTTSGGVDSTDGGRGIDSKESRRSTPSMERLGSRDRKRRDKEKRRSRVSRAIEFGDSGRGKGDPDAEKAQQNLSRGEKRQRLHEGGTGTKNVSNHASVKEDSISDEEAQGTASDTTENATVEVASSTKRRRRSSSRSSSSSSPAARRGGRRRRLLAASSTLVHDLTQDD